jgi:hypothetical protein
MRRLVLAVWLGTAMACSGGGDSGGDGGASGGVLDQDYAPNFVGTWSGTMTISAGGTTTPAVPESLVITATGENALNIEGFCLDGAATTATVTSATTFAVDPVDCAPVADFVQQCETIATSHTGGTGTISGGTLTVNTKGTATCVVSSQSDEFPFTAKMVGTQG